MERLVDVRAATGQIVRLIALDEDDRLVYVVHPESLDRARRGLTEAVGVPREDVAPADTPH